MMPRSLATTEEMYPDKSKYLKMSVLQPDFLFKFNGCHPIVFKHQYSTDITDTAQLIFTCGTDSGFHVHEGLVSLCSLKGTMTGRDFNAASKQQPSSEPVWERPKHTTSDDGRKRSYTHVLQQSNSISQHHSSRVTILKNSLSHQSSKKLGAPQVF
jgi:hypothetical protein